MTWLFSAACMHAGEVLRPVGERRQRVEAQDRGGVGALLRRVWSAGGWVNVDRY